MLDLDLQLFSMSYTNNVEMISLKQVKANRSNELRVHKSKIICSSLLSFRLVFGSIDKYTNIFN